MGSEPEQQRLWHIYQDVRFLLAQSVATTHNFAIVTAWNPGSEIRSNGWNAIADNALLQKVISLKARFRRISGCSADLCYREEGWLVMLPFDECQQLAWEFEQNAFYWVDGDSLYLCPAKLPFARCELGSFAERCVLEPELNLKTVTDTER